ncbi:hypothetical protein [Streptomyces sp. NPDC051554]|uniref:hypothetical protein n=1 Tax=Streptomyces sp. NPDC051554 TaxID=3365656 RepID=UPI00378F9E1E
MTAELIHVNQGRVTFDRAVGHIATALSPLGAAASITATIGACAVEIGRFKLQAESLAIQRDIATGIIRGRQSEIVFLYNSERSRAANLDISIKAMVRSLDRMTDLLCDANASIKQHEIAEHLIPIMASELGERNNAAGDHVVRLTDSLRLGGIDAAVAAWRALER